MNEYQRHWIDRIVHRREEHGLEVEPAGKLSVEDALDVYANGYRARLTEALGEIYEGVWWVLGDEKFFSLADKYIAAHPSRTYNLSCYGEAFSEFLKEITFAQAPFLSDLARLEWLFQEVFHAKAPSFFDHAELHVLQTRADVALRFQEGMRLFSSEYTVTPFWRNRGQALDGPNSPIAGPGAQAQVEWDRPEFVLLHKQGQSVYLKSLKAVEYQLLELLMEGQTLEGSVTKAAQLFQDLTEDQVSQFFGDLVKTGVIAGVEVPSGTGPKES